MEAAVPIVLVTASVTAATALTGGIFGGVKIANKHKERKKRRQELHHRLLHDHAMTPQFLCNEGSPPIGEYRIIADSPTLINVLPGEGEMLCFRRIMRRYWRLENMRGQSIAEVRLHHHRRSWVTWSNNNGLDWDVISVRKRRVIASDGFKYFIEADSPQKLARYKWYLDAMELTKSLILPQSREVVGETRIAEAVSANTVQFDYKIKFQRDMRDGLFVLALSFIAGWHWQRAKSRTKVARYSAIASANAYGEKLVANARLRRSEFAQRVSTRSSVRARLRGRCIRMSIIPYGLQRRIRTLHNV